MKFFTNITSSAVFTFCFKCQPKIKTMNNFLQATIIEIERHGNFATSITLESNSSELFTRKKSGQFINIQIEIDGKKHIRSYSLHNLPQTSQPKFTIKRVENGTVSNHIFRNTKVGQQISVSKPMGKFIVNPVSSEKRKHFFFAAGSGITPIYTMIHDILTNEPNSSICLLYGNKSLNQILFRNELEALAQQNNHRFSITHLISDEELEHKKQDNISYSNGQIEKENIKHIFEADNINPKNSLFYICGPNTMNTDVTNILTELDIPEFSIFTESFNPESETLQPVTNTETPVLKYTLDDEDWETIVPVGKTLLEAIKANGTNPPHSCQAGICGMCTAQLTQGTVEIKNNFVLSEEEIAEGKILCCQSIPTSSEIEIVFED